MFAQGSTSLHARRIARFMLVWLWLVMGVAVASPLVQPVAMTTVCTGEGMLQTVAVLDDGSPAPASAHLDCPLCVPLSAPPPPAVMAPLPPPLPTERHALMAQALRQTAAALPWQARAPPTL
ncbi:DUF2946 family protein [Ottowia sp.]|uniref:DUF2946 family protein n=1 Tax=Ottowia sp. TaxID=1898956 RepID=UPI003A8AE88C